MGHGKMFSLLLQVFLLAVISASEIISQTFTKLNSTQQHQLYCNPEEPSEQELSSCAAIATSLNVSMLGVDSQCNLCSYCPGYGDSVTSSQLEVWGKQQISLLWCNLLCTHKEHDKWQPHSWHQGISFFYWQTMSVNDNCECVKPNSCSQPLFFFFCRSHLELSRWLVAQAFLASWHETKFLSLHG